MVDSQDDCKHSCLYFIVKLIKFAALRSPRPNEIYLGKIFRHGHWLEPCQKFVSPTKLAGPCQRRQGSSARSCKQRCNTCTRSLLYVSLSRHRRSSWMRTVCVVVNPAVGVFETSFTNSCIPGNFPWGGKVVSIHSCPISIFIALPKVISLVMDDLKGPKSQWYFPSHKAPQITTAAQEVFEYGNVSNRLAVGETVQQRFVGETSINDCIFNDKKSPWTVLWSLNC